MTGLDLVREAAERQGGVLRDLLADRRGKPVFDELAASGSRSAVDAPAYATVLESILEGYLMHHHAPRIFAAGDADLRILAGDFLYAYGLDRLTELGDLDAVAELAELIARCSQAELAGAGDEAAVDLWCAAAVKICCGKDQRRGGLGGHPVWNRMSPQVEGSLAHRRDRVLADEDCEVPEITRLRTDLAAALSGPGAL